MPSSQPGGRTPAQRQTDHASLARLSETLVPALVQKLAASGLGELEVREGEWRIRLRRPPSPAAPAARRGDRPRLGTHTERDGRAERAAREPGSAAGPRPMADTEYMPGAAAPDAGGPEPTPRANAISPAVGVFRPGPAIGARVRAGDRVGVVDLLGIPQDVPAPIDGILVEILPEGGEAVEYGETIAIVEAELASVTADAPEPTAELPGSGGEAGTTGDGGTGSGAADAGTTGSGEAGASDEAEASDESAAGSEGPA